MCLQYAITPSFHCLFIFDDIVIYLMMIYFIMIFIPYLVLCYVRHIAVLSLGYIFFTLRWPCFRDIMLLFHGLAVDTPDGAGAFGARPWSVGNGGALMVCEVTCRWWMESSFL